MRHWNRGRKTARNLLLALLLVFLIHASQGFPPYTARGMCRQFRHDYLLGELEPLYVQRDWVRPHRKNYHYTTIAARSGETYALFRYEDSLLGSHRDWSDFRPVLGEGSVCAANRGTITPARSSGRKKRRNPTGRLRPGPLPWRGNGWRIRFSPSPMKGSTASPIGTTRMGNPMITRI